MNSPFVIIIFGGTGDLARHKLFPALFSLYKQKQLGDAFYIVGFARRPFADAEYRELLKGEIDADVQWKDFAKHVYYQQGIFDSDAGYRSLITRLNGFDQEVGACITRLFYLATPPNHYETILGFLKSTTLSEGCGQGSDKWTRLAIEKPFGKDLETAKSLDSKLTDLFEEKQIYRVDHYLAKETVQNMLAFRFANSIFEPIWNAEYIDHVQITFAEKKGIGMRGNFFDGVGILRDVAQNHLLQLVATVAMEQPKNFTKEAVREARAAAIKSIHCIEPEEVHEQVVRGQYADYLNEKNVAEDSRTETFVAMKFSVDTPRFQGVPFYVRAGKEMPEDTVLMHIVFKQTCHLLFKEYGCPEIGNVITIRIQPNEGIGLRVIAKKPHAKLALGTVDMDFTYEHEFGGHGADPYEKLLMDILLGDQMLFNRSDELESSWEFITKILLGFDLDPKKITTYARKTWGPKAAQELIERDSRKWL